MFSFNIYSDVAECCGIYAIVSMEYSKYNRYSDYKCTSESQIRKVAREGIVGLDGGLGNYPAEVLLIAVVSRETPGEWRDYYANSRSWTKISSFKNTKTNNLCEVYQTKLKFRKKP